MVLRNYLRSEISYMYLISPDHSGLTSILLSFTYKRREKKKLNYQHTLWRINTLSCFAVFCWVERF